MSVQKKRKAGEIGSSSSRSSSSSINAHENTILKHKLNAALTTIERLKLERSRDSSLNESQLLEDAQIRENLTKKVEFLLAEEAKLKARLQQAENTMNSSQISSNQSNQQERDQNRKDSAALSQAEQMVRGLKLELAHSEAQLTSQRQVHQNQLQRLETQYTETAQQLGKLREEKLGFTHTQNELDMAKQTIAGLKSKLKLQSMGGAVDVAPGMFNQHVK